MRDYGNTNNGFSDVILDDYLTFGYKMNYNLNNNYNIYFNVDNIFDQNYLFLLGKFPHYMTTNMEQL